MHELVPNKIKVLANSCNSSPTTPMNKDLGDQTHSQSPIDMAKHMDKAQAHVKHSSRQYIQVHKSDMMHESSTS